MIEQLATAPRLVVEAVLEPVASATFQPTGFPDLGAAQFERPGGSTTVLVESVQSMTNHFEALGWPQGAQAPIEPLLRLPYLEVAHAGDGGFLTSSRLEPHRIAASYVRDAAIDDTTGAEWIAARLGLVKGRPLDWARIYRAVFDLDPLCLVHGVFFSAKTVWPGNPKVRRALAAVVEADGAVPAISGGLKRDDVQFSPGKEHGAEEGYGFVPFGRTEYTAETIRLRAALDLHQLRGYGLGEGEVRLLTLLALWELAALLEQPFRPRTACDLDMREVRVLRPDGFALPAASTLLDAIAQTDVAFERDGARRLAWGKNG